MGLSHTTTRRSQFEVCCNSVIAVLLTSIGYFTLSAFLLNLKCFGVVSHGQESGLVHQSKQGETKLKYWFTACQDRTGLFFLQLSFVWF
jgi:hypothetical protein